MGNINLNGRTILVTGAAGFIGAALTLRLLGECTDALIVGIDSMNDYYDVSLKEYRLKNISAHKHAPGTRFEFIRGSIADRNFLENIFRKYNPCVVANLAAQAGVRNSITNPDVYIESNIIGFYNILEACRRSYDGGQSGVEHLVYASSSSVYGENSPVPYSTSNMTDSPVSLYAATKKSDELLAHAYSKLYDIPSTGLRFFTVYGPAGRPDMAYFSFTDKFVRGESIKLFNYGNCERDFSYIDDIVEGTFRVMQRPPVRQKGADSLPVPPFAVYNIGGGRPQNLMDFVTILSEELKRAGVLCSTFRAEDHIQLVPMQSGDVSTTFADTLPLERDFGFTPKTPLRSGLAEFAKWYAHYYGLR